LRLALIASKEEAVGFAKRLAKRMEPCEIDVLDSNDAVEMLIGFERRPQQMTSDKIHLPFRWEFVPIEDTQTKLIRWNWRAFTHTGELAMQSENAFEFLTDCREDAIRHGYRAPV
jgi:hypothetical protein